MANHTVSSRSTTRSKWPLIQRGLKLDRATRQADPDEIEVAQRGLKRHAEVSRRYPHDTIEVAPDSAGD